MARDACPMQDVNNDFCTCTYSGCPRHGWCCQCVQYHRKKDQIPACFFPKDAEKTYDRSFQKFIEVWG